MSVLALLLVQAMAGPPAPRPAALTARPCPIDELAEGEVVVCGRRGESPHRLKPLPPRPDDRRRDPLAFKLPGGGEGRAYVFERRISDVPSRGIAVKATFPLGRKKPPKP